MLLLVAVLGDLLKPFGLHSFEGSGEVKHELVDCPASLCAVSLILQHVLEGSGIHAILFLSLIHI